MLGKCATNQKKLDFVEKIFLANTLFLENIFEKEYSKNFNKSITYA